MVEEYYPQYDPEAFKLRFPGLLGDTPTMMIGCPDGWGPVVWKLCEHLEAIVAEGGKVSVLQIKEKFGTLRFYYAAEGLNKDQTRWVSTAVDGVEWASGCICETCGTTQDVLRYGGWIRTLCESCRYDHDERHHGLP